MQCINCGKPMRVIQVGQVAVDVCADGCGGMWFDMLELKRLDALSQGEGQRLLHIQPPAPVKVDQTQRRSCPKCRDVVMMRHFYSPLRRVQVDQCPNCGGFWLDGGELRLIHEETGLSEERREAEVDRLVSETFGAELEAMEAQREEQLAQPSLLRRVLGMVTPSSPEQ